MTDLGPLNYFLGISTQRTSSGLFLTQTKYATEILEQAHMLNCNPCKMPVSTESKLGPDGDPVENPSLFRSLAGALQYLTFIRPDLSYAVQQICLYMHDPREPHYTALKRILRYVRGVLPLGDLPRNIVSFLATTSSHGSLSANKLFTAQVPRQNIMVSQTLSPRRHWVHNLLKDLLVPLRSTTLVYYDNVSVVYLSSNPVKHQQTKHIEIDIHFVRDFVSTGHVRVLHVPSRYQYADIFTKRLPSSLFEEFRSSLRVQPPPAPTVGVY
ncbi:ribonuclease H-like domain-containing protein [Tanacetum coccineum]